MSELSSSNILSRFKNKKIDKASALSYLRQIVENNENELSRVESLKVILEISKSKIEILNLYEFFENLLVSDYNDEIKVLAAKSIIQSSLEKGKKLIKWAIENIKSDHCLLMIFKELKSKNNPESFNLINFLKKSIGKVYNENYSVDPDDAFVLGILNTPNNYVVSFKDGADGAQPHISFDIKDGHVFRIYGNEIFPDLETLTMFPFLKRLEIKDADTEDLIGIKHLKSLEILELDTVDIIDINSIQEIGYLENLRELYILCNDKIDNLNFLSNLLNLEKLYITGGIDWEWFGKITELKNLDYLSKLKELHIIGNKITEIKNLESLVNLRSLNLCGNQITEIKGLESLVKLEILDLSGNQITEIKGLECLNDLKKLNLFDNSIPTIEALGLINSQDGVSNPQKLVELCQKKKRSSFFNVNSF